MFDKPDFLRRNPLTADTIRFLEERHRDRLETLQAVDELVDSVFARLQARSLSEVYVFYTSDNGFLMGQHNAASRKSLPYEESIRVPLLVTGPDVVVGARSEELVLNIDLAPTITDLAGIRAPVEMDGRSLVPLLRGGVPPWRDGFLIEHWPALYPAVASQPVSTGVRSRRHVYIRSQPRPAEALRIEFYDLENDPYQIDGGGPVPLAPMYEAWLDALESCAGAACRAAETAPE